MVSLSSWYGDSWEPTAPGIVGCTMLGLILSRLLLCEGRGVLVALFSISIKLTYFLSWINCNIIYNVN